MNIEIQWCEKRENGDVTFGWGRRKEEPIIMQSAIKTPHDMFVIIKYAIVIRFMCIWTIFQPISIYEELIWRQPFNLEVKTTKFQLFTNN